MIDYLNELREGCLEAYTGIVQGFKGTDEQTNGKFFKKTPIFPLSVQLSIIDIWVIILYHLVTGDEPILNVDEPWWKISLSEVTMNVYTVQLDK